MAAERIGRAPTRRRHRWPMASGRASAHCGFPSAGTRCAQIQIFKTGLPVLLSFRCRVFGGGQGLFLPVVVSKAALLYFFVSFSFRGTVNRSERARQDDLAIAHIGASVCTATYGRGRAHLLETTTELMPPAVARRRCGETREESLRRRHLSRGRAPARPAALQI